MKKIHSAIAGLDTENMLELKKTGAEIRAWIYATPLPADLENDIRKAYEAMEDVAVAVRYRQRLRIYRTLRLPGSRRVFSTFAAPTP